MSSSAIATPAFQAKIGSIQNQADTSAVYSAGVWSFKNSTALTSVTITDAGNVGIGTSSPVRKLDVVHPGSVFMSVKNSTNTVTSTFGCIADSGWLGTETNHPVSFYTNSAPRMTLDASGNVGVGVTPSSAPTGSLFVKRSISGTDTTPFVLYHNSTLNAAQTADTYINNGTASRYYQNAGAHIWQTAASGLAGNNITWSDTMRIDASGNLLGSGKTSLDFTATGWQLTALGGINGVVAGNADACATYNKTTSTGQVLYSGYSNVGSTLSQKFMVFADGNVRIAAGSTYSNLSDIKFKENIVDATPKLEDVLKLQVRNFTIKNEGLKAIGFIAQEFEQVFPALVVTSPDRDYEGNDLGTESKAIKESALIPILVKSIQELSAKNDALEARLAALESKP